MKSNDTTRTEREAGQADGASHPGACGQNPGGHQVTVAQALALLFEQDLHPSIGISPHTVASYKTTFRLLIRFLEQDNPQLLSAETPIERLDARAVEAFLRYLSVERGSSPATVNVRRAAFGALARALQRRYPRLTPYCQSIRAIRMLNDHGIYGRGSFIVGYPEETQETFMETIDLINSSGLPYYHPYLFYYSKNSLIHRDRERFGLRGLGLAWRHATMDAEEASRLMSGMPHLVDEGYTDGQSYIEEIYKCLRGEGYAPEEILELFRLKRDLQLSLEDNRKGDGPSPQVERILNDLSRIVR